MGTRHAGDLPALPDRRRHVLSMPRDRRRGVVEGGEKRELDLGVRGVPVRGVRAVACGARRAGVGVSAGDST